MLRIFRTLCVLCSFLVAITACYPGKTNSRDISLAPEKDPDIIRYSEKSMTTYRIIPSQNDTFGYDVFSNGKLLIHQPNKPALPGNEGFETEEQAISVAEFVSKKIQKLEMPPTVTLEDLKTLGVLK